MAKHVQVINYPNMKGDQRVLNDWMHKLLFIKSTLQLYNFVSKCSKTRPLLIIVE